MGARGFGRSFQVFFVFGQLIGLDQRFGIPEVKAGVEGMHIFKIGHKIRPDPVFILQLQQAVA
ncbi:hypothetical protein D3C86_1756630 [compost metagenome]